MDLLIAILSFPGYFGRVVGSRKGFAVDGGVIFASFCGSNLKFAVTCEITAVFKRLQRGSVTAVLTIFAVCSYET